MKKSEIDAMRKEETSNWWYVGRRRLVLGFVQRLLKPRSRILDVGCGTGGNALELSKQYGVLGIDSSERCVQYCKDRGISAVRTSIEDAGFKPEFDCVLMMDVLEHIKDDSVAIRKAVRALKPGGILYITVPAGRNLFSEHDRFLGHFRRYEKDELEQKLRLSGDLEIVRLFWWNSLLYAPVLFMRVFLRRTPSEKTDVFSVGVLSPLLSIILGVENWLALRGIWLPFGVSLVAIYRKKANSK